MNQIVMTNLDDYIKYHTAIDFKLHGEVVNLSLLKESMQHIDNIDVYTNDIIKKLINYIEDEVNKIKKASKESSSKSIIENINIPLNLTIYKNDINLPNVFFDEIHFYNSKLTLEQDETHSYEGAWYTPDMSGIDKNGKYIVALTVFGSCSIDGIKTRWVSLLAHEIAHAYEDYCKNPNTFIEDKTFKYEDRFKPGYVYKALLAEDDRLRHFVEVLYFSFDSEVVAMKNEICQELMARRIGMRDFKLANEQLKSTRVYKRLATMEENLDEIEKIIDSDTQFKLKRLYDVTFDTHTEDYSKMLKRVNAKFAKAKNKIISAAGNYLYNAYSMRNNIWGY